MIAKIINGIKRRAKEARRRYTSDMLGSSSKLACCRSCMSNQT